MKISIDTPCHENWETMQPNSEGAHCFSCQKSVIDFSQKSTHEIKLFFGSIADSQKICGRFRPEQLKELSFDDFFEKFKKWILPHKIAVIMVFTFGLGLFSCDDKPSYNHLIGAVVSGKIISDTISKDDTVKTYIEISNNEKLTMGEAKETGASLTKTITPQVINKVEQKYLKGDIAYEPDTLKKKICHKVDSITEPYNTKIMGGVRRIE